MFRSVETIYFNRSARELLLTNACIRLREQGLSKVRHSFREQCQRFAWAGGEAA